MLISQYLENIYKQQINLEHLIKIQKSLSIENLTPHVAIVHRIKCARIYILYYMPAI